ncbi:MAG: hypothetical protein IPK50_18665 [Fibrobacterota bacterium]|nr:MAG: hypothetical protein IPK50_18665 [Fibrobacterota bacterium]
MATFRAMPTPALLLHSVLLSLSQMTGLIPTPGNYREFELPPWEGYPAGTKIFQKSQGFDSTGRQTDSSRLELFILPDLRLDLAYSQYRLAPKKSGYSESYRGFAFYTPADSMKQSSWTDSTGPQEDFRIRKEVVGSVTRWITLPGPGFQDWAPFDTCEQTGDSLSALQVRREVDLDGDVRMDSVWRTSDRKWIKATETLLASTGRAYSVNRRTHRYGYQNGVLVADTISSRGANSFQGLDTTWQDTLRYGWEKGKITRYTLAADTVWMEWSSTGKPVRLLDRSWYQTTPEQRSLSLTLKQWDAQGRITSHLRSDDSIFWIDSSEYTGNILFPSRDLYLRCTNGSTESQVFPRGNCRVVNYEMYQTEISGVPLRSPAKGIRQATVRMDGKKAIFQNLSIAAGVLEMVSLDGKTLGQTLVTDGQATLVHPPRGVCLWRVRSPTGIVSEASRLILP